MAAAVTAFLPLAVFAAVHLSVLGDAEHLWGALLLGFGPMAFICCLRVSFQLAPGQLTKDRA